MQTFYLTKELITGMRALEFGKTISQKKRAMFEWVKEIQQEKKVEVSQKAGK